MTAGTTTFQQVIESERLLNVWLDCIRMQACERNKCILMSGLRFCLLSVCGDGKRPPFSPAVQDIWDSSLPKEPFECLHICVFALSISQPQWWPKSKFPYILLSYLVQPPDVPLWQPMVSVILVVKMYNYLAVQQKKKVTKYLWSTELDSDLRQTNESSWEEVAERIHCQSGSHRTRKCILLRWRAMLQF